MSEQSRADVYREVGLTPEEIAQVENVLQKPRDGWRDIATAPKDRAVLFWIAPKSADETYTDTSGRPILAGGEPFLKHCLYGHWGCLFKGVLWHDVPTSPDPPAVHGTTDGE